MKLRKIEYPNKRLGFEGRIDYKTEVCISYGEVELSIESEYGRPTTVELTIKDLEELLASAKESQEE